MRGVNFFQGAPPLDSLRSLVVNQPINYRAEPVATECSQPSDPDFMEGSIY